MKNLCIIYNFAAQYREGIFRLLDKEYDCYWFFGDNKTDIKGLDLNILKNVSLLKNRVFLLRPFYFQSGSLKLLQRKDFSTFLILGDVFCISTWIIAILAKLFYRDKHIYFWSHGWYGKENRIRSFFKKIFFSLADATFLYGNYAKKLMQEEGFTADKLFVIHNSLLYQKQLELRNSLFPSNLYKEHFGNSARNLIFIGRLTPVKKIDLLIEALLILKQSGLQYNLTLVGGGIQEASLKELVEQKYLNDNVWFYGACYDEIKNAELIYNADLCVSPGNVGFTAIHSMMFGTPVITHSCFKFQMPEFEAIHEGLTGSFFDYDSASSIADCIVRWDKKYIDKREEVRLACFNEIDKFWTPQFQLEIIKTNLKFK